MDSRFTFKDFVFVMLFVVVIGAVVWAIYQAGYQEQRLNDVKTQLAQMDDVQKQQLGVLTEIRNAIKNGVKVDGGNAAGTQTSGRIRRTEADGSLYVYYPDVPDSPRAPDKAPDYATGDWLIENVGMEPEVLTPFLKADMGESLVQGPVLESMLGLNPQTMEWEPNLADWYRASADGLKYTYHLRPQACFSDGVKMTADDVVFSFNTMMNPDVDSAQERAAFDKVKECRKVDDETVEFRLSEPYFQALAITGGMSIIPEHIYKFDKGEEYNKRGDVLVGSGPYRLEKWDRGQKITLMRNEKYWGDRPTYDKIVYLFIGNSESQVNDFLAGQLDYLGEPIMPDPEMYLKYSQDAEFLKKFKAYKYSTPEAMFMYVGWNMAKPMFADKQTRAALTMLVNRKQIIDEMLKGFGSEMTGPFTAQRPQNDPTVKPLPYDMEGAKKLLAEAGWKAGSDGVLVRDGVRFEFNLSMRTGVPVREQIGTYMQQQFKEAGINMRITPYESSVLLNKMENRDFDAVLAGWGAGMVEEDPRQIWDSSSIANKGSNAVSYRSAEADKLIEEGDTTIDPVKRMEIWHKFQRVVYEDQPYIFLYSEVDCAFVNGRFKNTDPYPLGMSELDWYVPLGAQKYR